VNSGDQWIGEGKQYSGWYMLQSDPLLRDTIVRNRRLRSRAIGRAGRWQSAARSRSPYGVTWKFQMQGHDESSQLTSFFVISQRPS